jgi:hypothetical protein
LRTRTNCAYWKKLKSDFACAAYCLDPEFWDAKPWENERVREALMNVSEKLLYPLKGVELQDKLREVEAGYRVYFTKSGLFSKAHIWPRVVNGVVDSRDLIPAYEFHQSYGASMGAAQPLAVKIVAQVGSATIAEQNCKQYVVAVFAPTRLL